MVKKEKPTAEPWASRIRIPTADAVRRLAHYLAFCVSVKVTPVDCGIHGAPAWVESVGST